MCTRLHKEGDCMFYKTCVGDCFFDIYMYLLHFHKCVRDCIKHVQEIACFINTCIHFGASVCVCVCVGDCMSYKYIYTFVDGYYRTHLSFSSTNVFDIAYVRGCFLTPTFTNLLDMYKRVTFTNVCDIVYFRMRLVHIYLLFIYF